jgi:hypothetical protein
MREDLAIGQGTVNRSAHGAEIALAQGRTDGGARQFAVRKFDVVGSSCFRHFPEELRADLVS